MSATAAIEEAAEPKKKGGKKKLILIAVPVVLAAAGAGGWFSGVIPKMLHKEAPAPTEAEAAAKAAPVFVDLPDIIANLNTGGRRTAFIKLKAKLEVAHPEDQAAVQAAMPRVLDLFQGYLREIRPEELRGSAATYRLREELAARTTIAAAPAHVLDVLFTELLVQ